LLGPTVQRPRKIVSKLKKVPSGGPRQVDFLAGKVTFKAQGLGMPSSYKIINLDKVAALGKENLSSIHAMYRAVIKRQELGIPPGYYGRGPRLLS